MFARAQYFVHIPAMEDTSTNHDNAQISHHSNKPRSGETVRQLVQDYLDELKSVTLDAIELWSVENAVQTIVSHSTEEIRNLSFKMLIEKGNQSQDSLLAPLDREADYLASIREIGIRNITRILEDLVNEFSPINDNDDISDDEYRSVLKTVIQDTVESASEIVKLIMGSVPTRKLDKHSWMKVKRRISVFFFCRFTKEFVVCLVAKLKNGFLFCSPADSDASLAVLLDKVDWLVEKMLPNTEDQESESTVECYFTHIAMGIREEQLSAINKQLVYSLVLYLNPGQNVGLRFRRQVQEEANALVDEMLGWLKQQAEQHEEKTDLTSAALVKIEKVTENLLALADGLSGEEEDTSQPDLDDDFAKNEATSSSQAYAFHICHFMVVKMVAAFVSPCAIHIYWYNVNSLVLALTERLFSEIRDCEIVGEVNDSNADALFVEMKKELSGGGNCSCWVQMSLLGNDPYFLDYALGALKRHLVSPPKKFNTITFLKRLYKRQSDTPLFQQSLDKALLWRKLDIPDLGKWNLEG